MCATKGGRTNHERKAHRRESVDYKCPKCNDSFSDQAALTNHFKACQGGQGGFCPKCQRSLSRMFKSQSDFWTWFLFFRKNCVFCFRKKKVLKFIHAQNFWIFLRFEF